MSTPLTNEQIADLWDFDLSQHWVRVKLAERIRNAGYIVVPATDPAEHKPFYCSRCGTDCERHRPSTPDTSEGAPE